MGKKTVRGHDIANRFVYSLKRLLSRFFIGINVKTFDTNEKSSKYIVYGGISCHKNRRKNDEWWGKN